MDTSVFALFISDLHLQEDMPATTEAFLKFLDLHAAHARQVYLMGDIFEAWAGDDDINSPFPAKIVTALKRVNDLGVQLFWLAGNRDFLVGEKFANATGLTLLSDPHTLNFSVHGQNHPVLLSHGDTLCTDDIAYQKFRSLVRQNDWQSEFLALPLSERKAVIAQMRAQSRQHQHQVPAEIMDVNAVAVDKIFEAHHTHILIHGHTHRPDHHTVGQNQRIVLSDWDCDHEPARGDWLALLSNGKLQRIDHLGTIICDNVLGL